MRVMRLLALLCALALASVGPFVAGADDAVIVRASAAEVDFPRGVTFRLEAESTVGIADVQLQVSTPGRRYGAAVRNVRPSFAPGQRVSAAWTWARSAGTLPPGAEITYRWRITDAEGRVTETPQASVRVQDDRHEWRELREGAITVRWYRGDDRFGRSLLTAVQEGVDHLRRLQGVDLRHPLTVHVYGSQRELFEALPGVPAWIGGIAIPEFDTVIVAIAPNNLAWGRRALTHEVAHQLIYQMTAHPTLGSRVPTWLNEGLAVVAEGDTEPTSRRLLDDAISGDTLPTLRALSAPFSARDGHLAGVAYAAAESAVRFMLDAYGPERMRTLLLALGEGLSPEEAAQRAYGRSLDEIEDAWRTSLGLRPFERDRPAAARAVPTVEPMGMPSSRTDAGARGPVWATWLALALVGLTLVVAASGAWLLRRRLG